MAMPVQMMYLLDRASDGPKVRRLRIDLGFNDVYKCAGVRYTFNPTVADEENKDANTVIFDEPVSLAFHNGNVYVGDAGRGNVRRISSPAGSDRRIFTAVGLSDQVNADQQGNIPTVPDSAANQATFNSMKGISIDPSGSIFVASLHNIHRVGRYQQRVALCAGAGLGSTTTEELGQIRPALVSSTRPSSINSPKDGLVQFGDGFHYRIRRLVPAGYPSIQ